jgi:two-component system sensor histidine kinase MtrB
MAADVVYDDRGQLDAPTSRAVELLQNQLDRFEELLVDLLEVSRFDAGVAVLDSERTDIVALVQRAIEAATPLAERGGMQIRLADPDQTCSVECDPRRVHRIIRNLIENAVEHGDARGVDVVLGSSADAIAVTVRDYGVGLRPGESGLVFNRFWRADPARARTTGGTGLGLAIALEDARLHGGWLEAWGEPGKGACFRLTLPITQRGPFDESPLALEPVDIDDVLDEDIVIPPADELNGAASTPAATFVINGAERRS